MGTLQQQQDIYAESTKAHLNELSTAQEDLYKSLLNADSINTVADALTGLTEATTTWVDSLGGGIGVLKNLGAIGTNVFSKQIAGGINNVIKSFTRSSSNKKIIADAFQQAVNIQNIDDNPYTKNIMEQQKRIINVSSILKPEELEKLQNNIRGLAPTIDELNRVSELSKQYEKIKKDVVAFKNISSINDIAAIQEALTSTNAEVNRYLKEANFFQPMSGRNKQGIKKETVRKDLGAMSNFALQLSQMGVISSESDDFKNWLKVQKQFTSFLDTAQSNSRGSFVPKITEQYNKLAESASKAFTRILQSAKGTNDAILQDLLDAQNDVRESAGEKESRLNKFIKDELDEQENSLAESRRQQTIQDLVDIAAGIQSIGATISNIKSIGSIWQNEDLSRNEQIAQTLSAIGQTAITAVPGVISLVNAINLLKGSHPVLMGLTAAFSVLAFILPQFSDFPSELEKAQEKLAKSVNEYQDMEEKLESLESKISDVNTQLKELYSIADKDLTITNKEDIHRLEAERIELQAQLDLQKQLNEQKAKQVLVDTLEEREAKKSAKPPSIENEDAYILAEQFDFVYPKELDIFNTNPSLFKDSLNIFQKQRSEEKSNSYATEVASNYFKQIYDAAQKGDDLSSYYNELKSWADILSKDQIYYDEDAYIDSLIADSGIDSNNIKFNEWTKKIQKVGSADVDQNALNELQSQIDTYYSPENQQALRYSRNLSELIDSMLTYIREEQQKRTDENNDLLTKSDVLLPLLRGAEVKTPDQEDLLKDIEAAAREFYKNQMGPISANVFGDLTEEQYKNAKAIYEEDGLQGFLTYIKEILPDLDPQEFLDKYYHGLSLMDVLAKMFGLDEDTSWTSFVESGGIEGVTESATKSVETLASSYDEIKDKVSLIKAAQEQLSSKGTLEGWEQEGVFNDLLKEFGILEKWNNLLGYTSDEKIAWLEEYLQKNISIADLEKKRADNLRDLAYTADDLSSGINMQSLYIDFLKEQLKTAEKSGDQEKYNKINAQLTQAKNTLNTTKGEYDAIIAKIKELQNVDEDTARLILSQYNTVQKLERARQDGIITQETYNAIYSKVLKDQLASLGITEDQFEVYKKIFGLTDDTEALQRIAQPEALKALKEAFDWSNINFEGLSFDDVFDKNRSQVNSLKTALEQLMGVKITGDAARSLFNPKVLALIQDGINGNTEALETFLTVFYKMVTGEELAPKQAEEWTNKMTAAAQKQAAIDQRILGSDAENILKTNEIFKGFTSINLPDSTKVDFGALSAEQIRLNYQEEVSDLRKQLEKTLGRELTEGEVAQLYQPELLSNLQKGLEGDLNSLESFFNIIATLLGENSDTFKSLIDTYIKENAGYTDQQIAAAKAAMDVEEISYDQVDRFYKAKAGVNELTSVSLPVSTEVDLSTLSSQEIGNQYSDEIIKITNALEDMLGITLTKEQRNNFFDPEYLGLWQTALEGDAGVLEKLVQIIAEAQHIDLSGIDLRSIFVGMAGDKIDTYSEIENAYGKEKRDRYYQAYSDKTTKDVSDYGWDEDQFDAYVKSLDDTIENVDEWAESTEDQKLQLELLAKAAIRTGDALEDLSKIFKDNAKILKDADKGSTDYNKALAAIRKSVGQLLGLENDAQKSFLSDDFFNEENLALIEEAAENGGEALDELRKKASEEIVVNIGTQMDENRITSDVTNMLNDLQSAIDSTDLAEIKLGASIDTTPLSDAFYTMLESGQFTADELNAILASIGFSPTVTTEQIPLTDEQIAEARTTGYVVDMNGEQHEVTGEALTQAKSDGYIELPVINGHAPRYVGGGARGGRKSGSGGGGGGGKKSPSKPKTEKPKEDNTDPFHDINIKIQKLGESYEELEDKRDGLLGKDLIDNLNKELDILDKQNEAYREKLRIAEMVAKAQREELSQQGVEFDESGQISNYQQLLESRLEALNKMIDKYNHMSAEEQEAYEETLQEAQEAYDQLVEDIAEYEELINETVPEVQQAIKDNLNKKIEIEIEKFKLAVEVRLDMGEAQREWNEFKNKVIKELDDEDILGNAKANLEDLLSYYNTNGLGGGAIQSLTEQIQNTMIELNKINSNGWSDIYGDNHKQALEDLKNYTDELKGQLEDVKDLTDEINESVFDTIDKIKDDFDEQIDAYGQVSDLIQHDMRIIELLYGEDEYGALGEFYDKQAESNKSQIEFLRMQTEFWQQQMAQTDPGSEAWEAMKDNYEDSLNNLNDALEDALQNMIDKYTNAINNIFDKLEDKITDGVGLDYVGEEWDLINRNADQYLDTINAAYAIQDSQQKYLNAINESADPSVQRRLNDLMNDQLKILREKEKITQYDVDRANMMLDIELKRIALEEQQQNKTKLRLRRDTQGNYTYQYVTDEDNIAAAREELAAAQNDLYNFDKAQYQDTLNEMYDTYKEFQEKMLAIYEDTTMTDEERERQKALIIEQYGQLINNMTAENAQIRKNLEESAFTDLADIYNTNIEQYQNMTQQEKDILLNDLVPAWDSSIQHMVDTFVAEGGFVPTCIEAFEQLEEAIQKYKEDISSTTGAADVNTDDLLQGIDTTIDSFQQFIEVNDQLINAADQELSAIRDIISELDQLIAKYLEAKNAAIDAVNSGFSSYQGDQNQNALDYEQDNSSGSTGTAIDRSLPTLGQRMKYMSGRVYSSPNGEEPSSSMASGQEVVITKIQPGALKPYQVAANGQTLGWLDKTQLARFKSGGYTGEWGDYGKLAVLDQKELILNQDDTANILAAVDIVRNIADDLDSIMMERLANISASIGVSSKDFPSVMETIEQQVHIEASFPNVTSFNEIQEAFNNLVNVAAQRAMNSNR